MGRLCERQVVHACLAWFLCLPGLERKFVLLLITCVLLACSRKERAENFLIKILKHPNFACFTVLLTLDVTKYRLGRAQCFFVLLILAIQAAGDLRV